MMSSVHGLPLVPHFRDEQPMAVHLVTQVGYTLLSCTPLSSPLMHSSHTLLSYTPLIYSQLLAYELRDRLTDLAAIRHHPFFEGLEFAQLQVRSLKPPESSAALGCSADARVSPGQTEAAAIFNAPHELEAE
jgi:hypothetical protein